MAGAKGGRKLILAVDDEESLRDLYETQIPMLGYDVRVASGAGEARSLLRKKVPDLILMDVMMGEEDGLSLTRELRADPRTSRVPIIIVSALTDAASLSDAMLFGATDYVTKPFDTGILKAKLERALG